jgi:prepilin-type N-terminal cleavage/methylation domain-containing protein
MIRAIRFFDRNAKAWSAGCHAHGFAWACRSAGMPTSNRGHGTRCICGHHGERGGFSLPEVLMAMTLGAVIFGLSVELLSVAMHTDSVGGRTTQNSQSIDRLAEQFRDDVRQATAIHPMPDANQTAKQAGAVKSWTLEFPGGGNVEYSRQGDLLLRTESTGKRISTRDAFAIGDGVTARVELPTENHATEVTLVLERRGGQPNGTSPIPVGSKLRVAVPIGFDRRFAPLADKSQTK